MSLKSILFNHIRNKYPQAVHGGDLERYGMECGFKASNSGRRCRELENEGQITAEYNEKREVLYRWNPSPPEEKEKMYVKKLKSHPIQMEIVNKINSLSPFPAAKKEKVEAKLF